MKCIVVLILVFSNPTFAQTMGMQDGVSAFKECTLSGVKESTYKTLAVSEVMASVQMLNGCPTHLSTKTITDDQTEVFWMGALYKVEHKKSGQRNCKYNRYNGTSNEGFISYDRLLCESKF